MAEHKEVHYWQNMFDMVYQEIKWLRRENERLQESALSDSVRLSLKEAVRDVDGFANELAKLREDLESLDKSNPADVEGALMVVNAYASEISDLHDSLENCIP